MIPHVLPILSVGFHRRGENLRERLVALVQEEPGIHLARAARILGVPANSLHFHVHRLLRSGQLLGQEQGKSVHLFLPMTSQAERDWRIALADPGAQALADLARVNGELGIQQASRILGQSRKVVRKHLLRLAASGLLEREPGHHGRFSATPLLMEGASVEPQLPDRQEESERPRLPDCT